MLAASILLASACALWLGWRYEETVRARLVETARQADANRARDVRVAEIRGTIDLEVAKLQADSQLEIAQLARPDVVAHPPRSTEIVLPDDLEAHVMTWADGWARDDERGNLRRLYLEHHTGDASETWQRVRRAVGLGEMP